MDDLISRETVRETLQMYVPGFKWDTIDKIVDMMPSAQPDVHDTNVGDMASKQAIIDAIVAWTVEDRPDIEMPTDLIGRINALPSAQQTLYGYKIEHLAYIAKVMEKEGITAEYAVRMFDDMSRTMRMIIEEAQRKVEGALNE